MTRAELRLLAAELLTLAGLAALALAWRAAEWCAGGPGPGPSEGGER